MKVSVLLTLEFTGCVMVFALKRAEGRLKVAFNARPPAEPPSNPVEAAEESGAVYAAGAVFDAYA